MAALLRALWDWFWVSATAVDRVPTAPLSIKLGLFSLFVFVAVLCWVATRAEFGHAGAFCVAVLWPTIIPLLPAMLRAVLVQHLTKIALLVEQPYSDHRHTEVACGFELITGHIAEPA